MDAISALNSILSQGGIEMEMPGIILSLLVSAVCSLILFIFYETFYRYKEVGSQMHRAFFLIGPAITTIFIAIQFSLPLSLGLLGALSFIRFRTPIKDPEEVGYMMVLIATSICSATFNYGMLLAIILLSLLVLVLKEWVITDNFIGRGSAYLLVSGSDTTLSESVVTAVVLSELSGAKMLSVNSQGGEIHIQYSFKEKKGLDRHSLIAALKNIEGINAVDLSFNRMPA